MVCNISAISGRSLVKFEGGYTVETLFDGSKHGIEPYSAELSPTGDLLVLDCENSNLYKISTPLSQRMLIPQLGKLFSFRNLSFLYILACFIAKMFVL